VAFKPVPIVITPRTEAYFWQRVDKSPHPKGCWIWRGSERGRKGEKYGVIGSGKHRPGAHRYSYVLHKGEIPEGVEVCHECDNTLCVNPAHLWLGTHRQNLKDAAAKGRIAMPINKSGKYPKQKLNHAQVFEVVELLRQGFTHSEIARRYHISTTSVTLINVGDSWGNLTGASRQNPIRRSSQIYS
jgi:hypothetical protein